MHLCASFTILYIGYIWYPGDRKGILASFSIFLSTYWHNKLIYHKSQEKMNFNFSLKSVYFMPYLRSYIIDQYFWFKFLNLKDFSDKSNII